MKHLVVYSHPNPKSFNHAIKETLVEVLRSKGNEVRIRDLYSINFDPVLKGRDFEAIKNGAVLPDVAIEQAEIKWADALTFIYPTWWTGLPAMLKGYIDRVLTHGFAYSYGKDGVKGLLADKKAFIINTTGTPKEVYEKSGMFKSIKQTSDEGIFAFCGVKVTGHKFFAGVVSASDSERKEMLEEVKRIAAELS